MRLGFLAGVEGFEPPNDGVRVRSLTAWRHPNIAHKFRERNDFLSLGENVRLPFAIARKG